MKYFLITAATLFANVIGIQINNFTCEFSDDFCQWDIENNTVIWKLSTTLTSEDMADLDPALPPEVKDHNCLVAFNQGQGLIKSVAEVTPPDLPEIFQFELFFSTPESVRVVIHLYDPKTRLVFDSALENFTGNQWENRTVDNLQFEMGPGKDNKYKMTIEATIDPINPKSWFALKNFSTRTSPPTETTTNSDLGTQSTANSVYDTQNNAETTLTATSNTDKKRETTTDIENTGFQQETTSTEPANDYGNAQELNRFERFLRNLGWKNILAILLSVFFGVLAIAMVLKILLSRRMEMDNEEETSFDSLETVSSFHKYNSYYKNC